MNSWRFNSTASSHYGRAITKSLNIPFRDVYKTVKTISNDGIIETKDGKKYQLELKEIKNE